jgi:hypothetical protein
MARWQRFDDEAPELAAQVRARFEARQTHVLATLRRDGSPRVSGSEVDFVHGELTFGSMLGARKAGDLQRDGRCAIHAHPGDGDAKVSGIAVEVTDAAEKQALATGTEPPGDFHAFRLDLTEAVLTTVDPERQLLVIRQWRPGQGVRVITRR